MEVDCQTVKQRLDEGQEFLFLDVREPDEHALVALDGATLIPMSELQERASELEPYKDQEIVVFCHHGGRSLHVAMWLAQQGYKNVTSMRGGIDDWAVSIDTSKPRY